MESSDISVFVSSTCYDLRDLRAELEAHLRTLGLSPVLSDRPSSDFSALPNKGDSIETCLVNLKKCEVVLVILCQRYGRPLPGHYSPRSATHVEYLEALRLGKQTFFYVRDALKADYDRWRKNGEKTDEKLLWAKDIELLGLIKEREASFKEGNTGADAENNWIWPFTDSLQLKERVGKDLERVSRQALLRRLIRAGNLPVLSLVVTREGSTTPNFDMELSLWNAGQIAVLDTVWWDGETWRKAGVIQPNSAQDRLPYKLHVPDHNAEVSGPIVIRYSTPTGYSLEDTWEVRRVVEGDKNPRVYTLTRLQKRELMTGFPYEIV